MIITTIVFISVPLLVILAAFIVGRSLSTKPYKGPSSDHFNGKAFINPADKKAKGFPDVFKWMVGRDQGPWMKNYETFVGKKPKLHPKTKSKSLLSTTAHS